MADSGKSLSPAMSVRLVLFDALEGEEELELKLGEGDEDWRRFFDFRESFSGAGSANGSPSAGAGSAADKSPSAGAGSAN